MNETSKVAILCPSRGLIFAKTFKSIFNNTKGYETEFVLVEGLPIPDAQNTLVREALKTDCDWFFFVEEDNIVPDGALKSMIELDQDVVCVDYPVAGGWSTISRKDGEIQHCGLGCTLIKREVFEKIPDPWFRTDKSINLDTGKVIDIPMKYGGQDIFFGISLREHGYKIKQIEGFESEHLRCSDVARREDNKGTYSIYALEKVSKLQEK